MMYIPSDGYFLRILRLLSLPGGIVVEPEYEKYRIPYVISFTILLCSGLIAVAGALFIPDASQIQIMETIHFFSVGLNVLEIFGLQQLFRCRFTDLYMDIQHQYLGNVDFTKLSDSMSSRMTRKGLWLALWLYTVMNIPPILMLLTDARMGEMRTLVYPIWCPWPIDTIWKYVLIMGIQVMSTWGASLVFFGSIGMILCYIIAIRCKREIIEKDITQCFQLDANEERIRNLFRSIIVEHQDLMRFTIKVVNAVSYIAQMMALMFFVGVVMLTSIFLKAPNERMYLSKLMANTATVFIAFFVCCHVGGELETLNQRINEQLYGAPWYQLDIQNQKMILIFMVQNEKQFKLRIFKLYKMSLNFFLKALKNCYSAIQLLTAYFHFIRIIQGYRHKGRKEMFCKDQKCLLSV